MVATDIIRDAPWIIKTLGKKVMEFIGKSPAEGTLLVSLSVNLNPACVGAATLVYAATADELEELGKAVKA